MENRGSGMFIRLLRPKQCPLQARFTRQEEESPANGHSCQSAQLPHLLDPVYLIKCDREIEKRRHERWVHWMKESGSGILGEAATCFADSLDYLWEGNPDTSRMTWIERAPSLTLEPTDIWAQTEFAHEAVDHDCIDFCMEELLPSRVAPTGTASYPEVVFHWVGGDSTERQTEPGITAPLPNGDCQPDAQVASSSAHFLRPKGLPLIGLSSLHERFWSRREQRVLEHDREHTERGMDQVERRLDG